MMRKWNVLLAVTLLALVVGLGGCMKELELPSYDIRMQRQQEKEKTRDLAPQERDSGVLRMAAGDR